MSDYSVSFYLSGGLDNDLPSASLGGPRSTVAVLDNINNLLGSLADAPSPYEDYRCFYIVNTSNAYITNAKLFVTVQPKNSTISLGISIGSPPILSIPTISPIDVSFVIPRSI
jgi:hypothetical protein